MPVIYRRFNARNIELYPHTRGEDVGARSASDEFRYIRWVGFIDAVVAKAINGAIPVKLEVSRYCNNSEAWATEWIGLQPGQYVHGCLTAEGVYGVISAARPDSVGVDRCAIKI